MWEGRGVEATCWRRSATRRDKIEGIRNANRRSWGDEGPALWMKQQRGRAREPRRRARPRGRWGMLPAGLKSRADRERRLDGSKFGEFLGSGALTSPDLAGRVVVGGDAGR